VFSSCDDNPRYDTHNDIGIDHIIGFSDQDTIIFERIEGVDSVDDLSFWTNPTAEGDTPTNSTYVLFGDEMLILDGHGNLPTLDASYLEFIEPGKSRPQGDSIFALWQPHSGL
jgi:hypothetical protein